MKKASSPYHPGQPRSGWENIWEYRVLYAIPKQIYPRAPPSPPLQVLFSEGQAAAVITLSVVADGVPEGPEHVTVALMDVTTVGLEEPAQAATIAPGRARALLTILANGSPYGVVGWHVDSLFPGVQEPAGETPLRQKK